jgi:hypothetical protein
MSFTAHQLPLKMKANMAAACTNCTAVAPAERSAAFVSFRRQRQSLPPDKNVNSAPRSLTSAVQFSGNIAICAVNAVTTATNGSPLGQHSAFDDTSVQIAYP